MTAARLDKYIERLHQLRTQADVGTQAELVDDMIYAQLDRGWPSSRRRVHAFLAAFARPLPRRDYLLVKDLVSFRGTAWQFTDSSALVQPPRRRGHGMLFPIDSGGLGIECFRLTASAIISATRSGWWMHVEAFVLHKGGFPALPALPAVALIAALESDSETVRVAAISSLSVSGKGSTRHTHGSIRSKGVKASTVESQTDNASGGSKNCEP